MKSVRRFFSRIRVEAFGNNRDMTSRDAVAEISGQRVQPRGSI